MGQRPVARAPHAKAFLPRHQRLVERGLRVEADDRCAGGQRGKGKRREAAHRGAGQDHLVEPGKDPVGGQLFEMGDQLRAAIPILAPRHHRHVRPAIVAHEFIGPGLALGREVIDVREVVETDDQPRLIPQDTDHGMVLEPGVEALRCRRRCGFRRTRGAGRRGRRGAGRVPRPVRSRRFSRPAFRRGGV